MMQGMMNEDPDLTFACGMIPHQGVIVLAEAEHLSRSSGPLESARKRLPGHLNKAEPSIYKTDAALEVGLLANSVRKS